MAGLLCQLIAGLNRQLDAGRCPSRTGLDCQPAVGLTYQSETGFIVVGVIGQSGEDPLSLDHPSFGEVYSSPPYQNLKNFIASISLLLFLLKLINLKNFT